MHKASAYRALAQELDIWRAMPERELVEKVGKPAVVKHATIAEMKKTTIAISLLAVALVASNVWWAYQLLDAGVSYTYQGASLEESQQALSQALAIIKATSSGDASRDQIVTAANNAWPAGESFEKDGYLWVGRLGLRFSEAGKLVEVTM